MAFSVVLPRWAPRFRQASHGSLEVLGPLVGAGSGGGGGVLAGLGAAGPRQPVSKGSVDYCFAPCPAGMSAASHVCKRTGTSSHTKDAAVLNMINAGRYYYVPVWGIRSP